MEIDDPLVIVYILRLAAWYKASYEQVLESLLGRIISEIVDANPNAAEFFEMN